MIHVRKYHVALQVKNINYHGHNIRTRLHELLTSSTYLCTIYLNTLLFRMGIGGLRAFIVSTFIFFEMYLCSCASSDKSVSESELMLLYLFIDSYISSF